MKSFFFEDINIAGPENQQTSGIGPGSKTQMPMPSRIPQTGKRSEDSDKAPPQLPFEIQTVIGEISDIYVKLVDIKTNFEKACDNPSMKESQTVILQKAKSRIRKINKILLSIPILLDELFI
jgi:hypothetical protein